MRSRALQTKCVLALIASGCASSTSSGREMARGEPNGFGCTAVGPACGLTIYFDDGALGIGSYAITIETSEGTTTCDYTIEPTRMQTAEEAEQQDAELAACAEDDTCPGTCSGPDRAYPRDDSLTIEGGSQTITVRIENTETGAESSKTFTPDYEPHPEQTADCQQCDVATDTMPRPVPE